MEHDVTKRILENLQDASMFIAIQTLDKLQQSVYEGSIGELDKDNLTEDIAEVYIVLDWIKAYYNVDNEELTKCFKHEENRLINILNRGEFK